jgi:hypothetical protein
MSSTGVPRTGPRSRWRFLIAPRWLAWHAFTVAAVAGMLWLGLWQFRRAESGNALSWAYTFEWPIFAAFGIVFWAKTILDEGRPKNAAPGDEQDGEAARAAAGLPGLPGLRRRAGAGEAGDDAADEGADIELDEYNAYLAKLSRQVQGHGRWHGLR